MSDIDIGMLHHVTIEEYDATRDATRQIIPDLDYAASVYRYGDLLLRSDNDI